MQPHAAIGHIHQGPGVTVQAFFQQLMGATVCPFSGQQDFQVSSKLAYRPAIAGIFLVPNTLYHMH